MLPHSFLFLPGVGPRREIGLWRRGVRHWDDYPQDLPPKGVPRAWHKDHCRLLAVARTALENQDLETLSRLLPRQEHWRFWGQWAPRVGCLDIETTGTHDGARVTVLGVHEPATGTTRQLVAGRDLDAHRVRRLLAAYDILVTFNGTGFDLPVLRAHYPGCVPGRPHLDLRGPLRRLGYKGGLKRIEADLGLARPDDLVGVDGWEAVRLWRRHERGENDALDTLLRYNDEDIRNLAPLARFATAVLANEHAPLLGRTPEAVPWPSGRRPDRIPDPLAAALAPAARLPQA